jgi:hypothetical protein
MEAVPLTDVQQANLTMLLTLKDSVQKDPAAACCKFGLKSDELQALSSLSADRILAIVANMGQQCLFPPRVDLGQLLALPLPLGGVMASARPSHRGMNAMALA